jgi:hypothetical protein
LLEYKEFQNTALKKSTKKPVPVPAQVVGFSPCWGKSAAISFEGIKNSW